MPFDGTKLDETTQVLLRAKEILLRDGWCINHGTDDNGRHCINGAIQIAAGELNIRGSIWDIPILWERLAKQVPVNYPKHNPAGIDRFTDRHLRDAFNHGARTASYNNAQISVEPVLELLDKAIASG